MPSYPFNLAVQCIVARGDEILVVKHSYGTTQGLWDFPRGYVESGETIEQAARREVREETSIEASPAAVVGLRHKTSSHPELFVRNDLMVIWRLAYQSGKPVPDGSEILETDFKPQSLLLSHSGTADWVKEILQRMDTSKGLLETGYHPEVVPDDTIQWKLFLA